MAVDAPPSLPAGAPPPTFVPAPAPVPQGQPIQGQPAQGQPAQPQPQQQGPPPPGAPVPLPGPPTVVYASVMPGYIMRPPRVSPQPGMVIVGYETYPAEKGCCKCEDLNPAGWMAVILFAIFFFPLAWVPCLVDSFHDPSCRPVYGWPQQQQQQQQPQQWQQPQQQYPVMAPPHSTTVNPKP